MDQPIPPRRKRSAAAGLTAAGAAAMLSGCDPAPSIDQEAQARFGPPTEVSAFQSVGECAASGAFSQVQCEEAQAQAATNDDKAAPRFEDRQTCEELHGEGQCQQRFANGGGGSFFTPLLTGFMIGQLLNGGGYRYHGLYRGRDGGYLTGSGAYLGRGNGYRYSVGNRAVAAPITTQRIQTRSSVVSRGGFGGRASSRGGWGGSRGG